MINELRTQHGKEIGGRRVQMWLAIQQGRRQAQESQASENGSSGQGVVGIGIGSGCDGNSWNNLRRGRAVKKKQKKRIH